MKIYRRFNTIKALTFDLDDTLYDNQPVIRRVESEMATWLHTNHPVTKQLTLKQWSELKFELLEKQPELKHDVTLWRRTQIEQGLQLLGYDIPKAKMAAREGLIHALWLRNQVEIPPESHKTLQALSKKFPLVAITNGNVDVTKIGLAEYFDLVLKAGPDGRSKPCSDMFITAAKHLGVEHREILHVGDHLISDVNGANRCNFLSCWINAHNKPINSYNKVASLPNIEIQKIEELLALC
jgi:putative hydrolase of the HAD superfamily